MKFDFNIPLTDFDGNPVIENGKEANLAILLSRDLSLAMNSKHPQKLKFWATKLYSLEILDLDSEDHKILDAQIRLSNQTAWVVASWLDVLDNK